MKKLLKTIFKITVREVRDMNTFQKEDAEFYTVLGFVVYSDYKQKRLETTPAN